MPPRRDERLLGTRTAGLVQHRGDPRLSMLSRDGLILGAHPEGEPEADLRTACGAGRRPRALLRGVPGPDLGVRPTFLRSVRGGRGRGPARCPRRHARASPPVGRAGAGGRLRSDAAAGRASAPSGKPRTSLHMPDRQPTPEPEVARADVADDVPASETPPEEEVASTPRPEVVDAQPEEPEPADDDVPEAQEGKEEESEVDRSSSRKSSPACFRSRGTMTKQAGSCICTPIRRKTQSGRTGDDHREAEVEATRADPDRASD